MNLACLCRSAAFVVSCTRMSTAYIRRGNTMYLRYKADISRPVLLALSSVKGSW